MRRRARIMQVVTDFALKPVEEMEILDLASLEGHYSLELALRGCKVTGIEGRQSNIVKAESERRRLGLENVSFIKDDVRNLSPSRYGDFDAVLCLGILYHLDTPDVFNLLESVFAVCRDFAVIDTLVSEAPVTHVDYKNARYAGWHYTEYAEPPSAEKEEASSWASLGNQRSFWLTRSSLFNALAEVGFTSVYECHNPPMTDLSADRITLVATKRKRQNLIATPLEAGVLNERWAEQRPPALSTALQQRERRGVWLRTRSLLGRSARRFRKTNRRDT